MGSPWIIWHFKYYLGWSRVSQRQYFPTIWIKGGEIQDSRLKRSPLMWNFPSCPCKSLQKEGQKVRFWWRRTGQGQQGTQSNASLPCSQHLQHHSVHFVKAWIQGKVFSKEPHTDKDPLPFIGIKQGNPQKRHTTHQQKIYPAFLLPFPFFSFLPAFSAFSFSFPPPFHFFFRNLLIYSTNIYYVPGEGNGNPLQYSCLEYPMDRGAWQATTHEVTRVRHDLATKAPPPLCPTVRRRHGRGSKLKNSEAGEFLLCLRSRRVAAMAGAKWPREWEPRSGLEALDPIGSCPLWQGLGFIPWVMKAVGFVSRRIRLSAFH